MDRGDVNVGILCMLGTLLGAETVAHAGFDWVCIDTQHSVIGFEQVVAMLAAVSCAGKPAFVRIKPHETYLIGPVLDAGAQGVIVPLINTRQQALEAVAECRYPPDGCRSWGPVRAALGIRGYSPEVGNKRTVCTLMVETVAGVEAIDEIVSVPGVDAIYIGANDLSVSHGRPPGWGLSDPTVRTSIEKVAAACTKHGVIAGIGCPDVETALAWQSVGFRMFSIGTDLSMLRERSWALINAFRERQQ
jgi:4-hydroxy-2-oxoheptanedioate aldolase